MQDSPVPGQSRSISDSVSVPPWLCRLWANQRLHLRPKTAHWWGVHISRFLQSVCREQVEGPVDILAKRFLEELAIGPSPPSNWQLDQVRQALDVFARGIEHWRFVPTPEGGIRPAFRLKTTVQAQPECTTAPVADGISRVRAPADGGKSDRVTAGTSWLTRFQVVMRLRNYSIRTEEAYREWIERYLRFHTSEDPLSLGEAEVREFLEYLVTARNVSASTQNQAFSALLFLYGSVLEQPLGDLQQVLRARRPARLPVVLSREEVHRLLAGMEGTLGLIGRLLYGTGLRVMEGLRLRVKDIDFDRGLITVREGKGDKDRTVMLPESLREMLQTHLGRVRILWESDRASDLPGVALPGALERKYPEAGKEWAWMWAFPGRRLSTDPRSGVVRRHHAHEKAI